MRYPHKKIRPASACNCNDEADISTLIMNEFHRVYLPAYGMAPNGGGKVINIRGSTNAVNKVIASKKPALSRVAADRLPPTAIVGTADGEMEWFPPTPL